MTAMSDDDLYLPLRPAVARRTGWIMTVVSALMAGFACYVIAALLMPGIMGHPAGPAEVLLGAALGLAGAGATVWAMRWRATHEALIVSEQGLVVVTYLRTYALPWGGVDSVWGDNRGGAYPAGSGATPGAAISGRGATLRTKSAGLKPENARTENGGASPLWQQLRQHEQDAIAFDLTRYADDPRAGALGSRIAAHA